MTSDKAPRESAASWTAPLERLDAAWVRLETWVCTGVLALEIVALCAWVSLHGLSSAYGPTTGASGLVFRCLATAVLLGTVAHLATRKHPRHDVAVFVATMAGLVLGRAWANAGVEYFSNFSNWLESSSGVAFFGGLRGLATRLTLWLALLGAAIATAKGKHIHVDVLVRFVPTKLRAVVAMIGALTAATVCLSASAAFADAIALNEFHTPVDKKCDDNPHKYCETTNGEKIANVKTRMARDFFLFREQVALDFKTLPHVLSGEKFNGYLTAQDWNTWARAVDWTSHLTKEQAESFILPEEDASFRRIPFINVANMEPTRALLVREGSFILPFGLLMIGLRFILRALLIFGGRVNLDPDAAHGDEELAHRHDEGLAEAEADALAAEGKAQ